MAEAQALNKNTQLISHSIKIVYEFLGEVAKDYEKCMGIIINIKLEKINMKTSISFLSSVNFYGNIFFIPKKLPHYFNLFKLKL